MVWKLEAMQQIVSASWFCLETVCGGCSRFSALRFRNFLVTTGSELPHPNPAKWPSQKLENVDGLEWTDIRRRAAFQDTSLNSQVVLLEMIFFIISFTPPKVGSLYITMTFAVTHNFGCLTAFHPCTTNFRSHLSQCVGFTFTSSQLTVNMYRGCAGLRWRERTGVIMSFHTHVIFSWAFFDFLLMLKIYPFSLPAHRRLGCQNIPWSPMRNTFILMVYYNVAGTI